MSAPSTTAVSAVKQALEDNAPNSMTVGQIIAEAILGETTVRTALKALIANDEVQFTKQGNVTQYSIKQPALPPAPEQPAIPAPPSGRKTAAPKQKSDARSNKAGARRKEAEERDVRVAEFLREHPSGYHRRELAEAMSEDYDLLYIALWRLNRDGVIGKYRDGSRSPVWRIKDSDDKRPAVTDDLVVSPNGDDA